MKNCRIFHLINPVSTSYKNKTIERIKLSGFSATGTFRFEQGAVSIQQVSASSVLNLHSAL